MTWDVICQTLQNFGPVQGARTSFEQGENLLLFHKNAADLPHTIYVAMGETVKAVFHHALIVSIGPDHPHSDNLIRLESGTLAEVFNALAERKNWLGGLNNALSLCATDQEVIDRASIHLGLPMFYLDQSYRILAITKSLPSPGDTEWIHMSEKGYLSPQSAQRMKEAGDLDLLATSHQPMVYDSEIYPFASIVCNVWQNGTFISRLNILCVNGDTSPLMRRACELIVAHLTHLAHNSGRLLAEGPLQGMFIDLLHGIRLSDDLIQSRLKTAPLLSNSLMQLFFVDVEARDDRQIAPYYASLLKRLMPEETFLPLVFQEQLLLLVYGPHETAFDSITVKLSHFVASHHLRCGVSCHFRRLAHLRGYYDQAAAALRSAKSEGLHFYQDIMLDHILAHIPTEEIPFLISTDLARLEEAEGQFAFSLTDTLRAYLECNCNLIRTAERLFLHKNTLLYRLNHIRGILRCDLEDADQRLLLQLSFKLLKRSDP